MFAWKIALIDYIPGIVAFAAAALAVIGGKTIDKSKRGLRRVTWVGWSSIILAVLALAAGIVITRQSQEALEEQKQQRKIIRSVADTEVRLAIRTITQRFFFLVGDDNATTRFALVPPHILDMQRVQAAQSMDIRESPSFVSPPTSWAELLKSSGDRGSQQLT
jgi:hypothetical protein